WTGNSVPPYKVGKTPVHRSPFRPPLARRFRTGLPKRRFSEANRPLGDVSIARCGSAGRGWIQLSKIHPSIPALLRAKREGRVGHAPRGDSDCRGYGLVLAGAGGEVSGGLPSGGFSVGCSSGGRRRPRKAAGRTRPASPSRRRSAGG